MLRFHDKGFLKEIYWSCMRDVCDSDTKVRPQGLKCVGKYIEKSQMVVTLRLGRLTM